MTPTIKPIVPLVVSNVFMTFAWYGHLKFTDRPLWLVVVASWGRIWRILIRRAGQPVGQRSLLAGRAQDHAGGDHAVGVRGVRGVYLGARITLNRAVGFALICSGAFFVLKGPLPS
jgi:uncharacterized protein (DUF486 family)